MKHRSPPRTPPTGENRSAHLLYGFHAVRQAWLNPARSVRRLLLTPAGLEAFAPVLEEAKRKKLTRPAPEQAERERLEQMLPGAVHQGIVLDAPPPDFAALDDVLRATADSAAAVLVVLDQVTDPHNVGAILRSAAAFGAAGVILPERNAPPLTGVLAKTASGAVDALPVVQVNNLARALDELKAAGFWTVGLAEEGRQTLAQADLGGSKVALVLGAEGDGLRRLTAERCDLLLRLPTRPPIGSLNVSNAAAVALYELARTRQI